MGRSARAQAQVLSLPDGGARDASEGMSTHSDLAGFRRPSQHIGLSSPNRCKPAYRRRAGIALPYSAHSRAQHFIFLQHNCFTRFFERLKHPVLFQARCPLC
jgi:hypothetical protein